MILVVHKSRVKTPFRWKFAVGILVTTKKNSGKIFHLTVLQATPEQQNWRWPRQKKYVLAILLRARLLHDVVISWLETQSPHSPCSARHFALPREMLASQPHKLTKLGHTSKTKNPFLRGSLSECGPKTEPDISRTCSDNWSAEEPHEHCRNWFSWFWGHVFRYSSFTCTTKQNLVIKTCPSGSPKMGPKLGQA